MSVSGVPNARGRPVRFDSDATPRALTSRQAPRGPSTTSLSGTARALSIGHSFGVRQSYGPHSSTMIADRGSLATGRSVDIALGRDPTRRS